MAIGTKIYMVVATQANAGAATDGYKWLNDGGKGVASEPEQAQVYGGYFPKTAHVVKVNANSAQLAVTGVRKAYGDGWNVQSYEVFECESAPGTAANTYETLKA